MPPELVAKADEIWRSAKQALAVIDHDLGAEILSFDGGAITPVRLEETSHYQITRRILENPEQYWKHLRGGSDGEE